MTEYATFDPSTGQRVSPNLPAVPCAGNLQLIYQPTGLATITDLDTFSPLSTILWSSPAPTAMPWWLRVSTAWDRDRGTLRRDLPAANCFRADRDVEDQRSPRLRGLASTSKGAGPESDVTAGTAVPFCLGAA